MPDNPTKRHPHDGKRINVNQDYELRQWATKFNTTPEKIRQAVKQVGDSSAAVRKHLGT